MASANMSYNPLTPQYVSSFVIPKRFRAFGMAPAGENKAWMLVLTLPMVILVDSTGHICCTGYVFEEMKRIHENSSYEDISASGLEGYRISPGLAGSCLILAPDRSPVSLKQIDQTGSVSTVISGLNRLDVDGIAYLPMPTGKGLVLYGDHMKGLCSINWPRSFLSRLFSSPVPACFMPELKTTPVSIAVDRNSDLLCVSDVSGKVFVINRQGQKISEYEPEDTENSSNQCVMFDHTGCILVHNVSTGSIIRLAPDGTVIQTLFPERKENFKFCETCNQAEFPTCLECKTNVIITAITVIEDSMWVARLTGEVEIYKLL